MIYVGTDHVINCTNKHLYVPPSIHSTAPNLLDLSLCSAYRSSFQNSQHNVLSFKKYSLNSPPGTARNSEARGPAHVEAQSNSPSRNSPSNLRLQKLITPDEIRFRRQPRVLWFERNSPLELDAG